MKKMEIKSKMRDVKDKHCVESVRIRSYSGPHFPDSDSGYFYVFSPNAGKYGPE